MASLLEVKDLVVKFAFRKQQLTAVNGVSFSLERGERLGLVGESGAGKSVTGFSILNLVGKPGYIANGQILFEGRDLAKLNEKELRAIRGASISMIFQDPMMTLNPVLTVGTQMIETLRAHEKISHADAKSKAIDCLRKVYISSPEKRLNQYPHEFSGGMRQRIVIAISLLTSPALIIADEPTTALDVTIQAEIMDLLLNLCEDENMGLVLITHDLGVVSQVTQNIAVMYAGGIVEKGNTTEVVTNPLHPYTKGLLAALPQTTALKKPEKGAKKYTSLNQIPGTMPTLSEIPEGCPFNPRCSECQEICTKQVPLLELKQSGRYVACHMVE